MARKKKRKSASGLAPREQQAKTAQQEPAADPAIESGGTGPIAVIAIVSVAALAFVAFIYTFAAMGESFVNSLDERVGEVLAARAARMANAYQFDEAIATYEQALAAGFEREPDHRIHAMRGFIELLEREGQTHRVIEVATEALELQWDYGPAFLALFSALRESKQYDAALTMLADQHTQAEKAGNRTRMALAKFNEGIIREEVGEPALAAIAYQESFDAEPSARCALKAIHALHSSGQRLAAASLVQYVLEKGTPGERRAARALSE